MINTLKKTILFLLLVILPHLFLPAIPQDGLISLRFYRGDRQSTLATDSVTVLVQFRPIFVGQLLGAVPVTEELGELKRIFNLADIILLQQNQMAWRQEQKSEPPQLTLSTSVAKGGESSRVFQISLQPITHSDRFKILVADGKNQQTILLESELTLPQGQSAVLGFEDPHKQPYFLSFSRSPDGKILPSPESLDDDIVVRLDFPHAPKLIHQTSPKYPQVAKQAGIQGNVCLIATLNNQGEVTGAEVMSGHPLLKAAAVEALKTWRYEPYKQKGKTTPVRFTVYVTFFLPIELAQKSDVPSIWPVHGYLTSSFGKRLHPITGKEDFHQGQDIAAVLGSPIVATAPGTVQFAGFKELYGNTVIIKNSNEFTTLFSKLDKIMVKEGDLVKRGQQIGTMGQSGLAKGTHLHYEVWLNGEAQNPMDYILQ